MSCSLFFKMPALDIVLDPFKGHAYDPLGPPLLSKTRRVLRWVGVIWDTTTQRYLPDIYLGGEPFSKDVRYVSLSSLSLNIWGEVRSLIASEVSWGPQQDFVTPSYVSLSKVPWMCALIAHAPYGEAVALHAMVQEHHPKLSLNRSAFGLLSLISPYPVIQNFECSMCLYIDKGDYPLLSFCVS